MVFSRASTNRGAAGERVASCHSTAVSPPENGGQHEKLYGCWRDVVSPPRRQPTRRGYTVASHGEREREQLPKRAGHAAPHRIVQEDVMLRGSRKGSQSGKPTTDRQGERERGRERERERAPDKKKGVRPSEVVSNAFSSQRLLPSSSS
ncbi:hypothetical protein LY76DRAFT_23772 [Colletotrichum caudatum]|nr:hypothetical protein LY76DRAFT_23772 [Colletotrichum caudatum]